MITYQASKFDIFVAYPGFYLLHLDSVQGGETRVTAGYCSLLADGKALQVDLENISRHRSQSCRLNGLTGIRFLSSPGQTYTGFRICPLASRSARLGSVSKSFVASVI